jgi:hypothetical protein
LKPRRTRTPDTRQEMPMAHEKYRSCIDACARCAAACDHCADACLGEPDVKMMADCIRLDRDYAEICWLAAALMSRGSRFAAALCRVCADVCEACGAECEKHKHDHCQKCAAACWACAEACLTMAA